VDEAEELFFMNRASAIAGIILQFTIRFSLLPSRNHGTSGEQSRGDR
jgi:hypothetical protein